MAGNARGTSEKESQYAMAKTSVWWDIENCQVPKFCDPHSVAQNISRALVNMNYRGPVSIVAYGDTNGIPASVQQALSSTGICLNHVPAGVKDASDKKILVDMLFWAVDNPAPANYLLISGDRDFSNALHQLRMRRYNILLAQPLQASAALVAAATTVWHWTTLVAGGCPLDTSKVVANGKSALRPDILQSSTQLSNYSSNKSELDNHNFANVKKVRDVQHKSMYVPKSPNQLNITKTTALYENTNLHSRQLAECTQPKPFKKAPHEFFSPNHVTLSSSKVAPSLLPGNIDHSQNTPNNMHDAYAQPQPAVHPANTFFQNSQRSVFLPSTPMPHLPGSTTTSSLNLSSNVSQYESISNFNKPDEKELTAHFKESVSLGYSSAARYGNTIHSSLQTCRNAQIGTHERPKTPPLPSIGVLKDNVGDCVWESNGRQQPSEHVKALIGVIILALNTLKNEKIMPTGANISNCIRYADLMRRNFDLNQALVYALDYQMIMKQCLGNLELFVGRGDTLWQCVNPIGGNVNQYPKPIWDDIQKYLLSTSGRSAIIASECKYEAALILKNECLKQFALGDVFQILDLIITTKKWILHPKSGWQPITVNVLH